MPGALVGDAVLLNVARKNSSPAPGNWLVLKDGTVLVCTGGTDGITAECFGGDFVMTDADSICQVIEPDLAPVDHELGRLRAITGIATDLTAYELELFGTKMGLAKPEAMREARFLNEHLSRLDEVAPDNRSEVVRLRDVLSDACYHADFVADMPLPTYSARAKANATRLRKRAEILSRMRCDLRTVPEMPVRSRDNVIKLIQGAVSGGDPHGRLSPVDRGLPGA